MERKKHSRPMERLSLQEKFSRFFQALGWTPEIFPCAENEEIIVFYREGLKIELFPDFIKIREEREDLTFTISYHYLTVESETGWITSRTDGK